MSSQSQRQHESKPTSNLAVGVGFRHDFNAFAEEDEKMERGHDNSKNAAHVSNAASIVSKTNDRSAIAAAGTGNDFFMRNDINDNNNIDKTNNNTNAVDNAANDFPFPTDAPFIAIHRPSVAYNHNGMPLLSQLGGAGAFPAIAAASTTNSAVFGGGPGSRAVSPSPSMMRGGSFANRSYSQQQQPQVAGLGTTAHRRSLMRSNSRLSRFGGSSHLTPRTLALQNSRSDYGGGKTVASSHLDVSNRGPAVRISSPGGLNVRVAGSHDTDSDKGEQTSDSDSSKSTDSSSTSGSSSTFSVGSSLNLDRVKSYFFRKKKGSKGLPLQKSSMFIFSGDNKFRLFVFNSIRSKGFEAFIILLIVANCVLLALNNPGEDDAQWQINVDYGFTAAFTTEAVLKLIAFGVVLHPGSYFRDPWNILDFCIVILSFLQMVPSIGNFTALRIFRVLRPLRSLNAVPALKVIVSGLLHSIAGLANVGILSLIVIGIFSIVGVQLWMGKMRYRCRNDFTEDIHAEMYCSTSGIGTRFTGRVCPEGYTCVPHENPWMGFVSFDNVFWAFLIVFQCITCEGWTQIQNIAMDTCGWYTAVYFVLVVLILNYFVLNLALAVINFQFLHAKEKMEERLREEREEEEMEMLAAAEEDEDYGRMLLPNEEKTMFLDQAAGMALDTAKGEGGSASEAKGFHRAQGYLTTAHMRMLKKTVAGKLIYSLEKSAKIRNLANERAAEKAELLKNGMMGGREGDEVGMEEGRIDGAGEDEVVEMKGVAHNASRNRGGNEHTPPVDGGLGGGGVGTVPRNPFKVIGSPTAAALALMRNNDSPHLSSPRSARVSPPASSAAVLPKNTAVPKSPSDSALPPTVVGGGALADPQRLSAQHQAAQRQQSSSRLGGDSSVAGGGGANLSSNVSFNANNGRNASFNIEPVATASTPNKSSHNPDSIVRVAGGLNATLNAGALAAAVAAAAAEVAAADEEAAVEEEEEIDFEEASALGSVDETPFHQRGYLRRKFDAKFGHLSWYRFAYNSPVLMSAWRSWLRLRYVLFQLSEGDPYDWHAYDFELLRQAAARDLADADVSKRKIPEPSSTLFSKFIVFSVLVNTGFMAASHYGEPQSQTDIFNIANVVFAAIFGVEMAVRMIGIGFTSYLFDISNLFDGVITVISLVEVIFLTGSSSFSVLRAFRLLRIFKLMKAVPSLRKILRVAVVAIQDTGYLCVIFLLYLFIAALVGMQLFGTSIRHQADDPRASFENFYMSFFTVFEILTRDSWPDIMRMTMRDLSLVTALYHLICVFMGDFIILNLFLAILISSFDSVANEADDDDLDQYKQLETIKRQPLGAMGALVSEQSKRLLRLADHKLRIVDPDAILKEVDFGETAALLAEENANNTANKSGGEGGTAVATAEGAAGGDQHNAPQTATAAIGVRTAEGELCLLCGEIKIQPFPPPSKLIQPMTPDELHSRMCARIALRKAKARVIRDLLEEIGGIGELNADELGMTAAHKQLQEYKFGEFDVGLGYGGGDANLGGGGGVGVGGSTGISLRNVKPSPETVDELFGRAWEAGLLLNRNADDYFNIETWAPISALLKEEQSVLNLHVGEELIGQSLVAYTRANVPREFFTNGGKSLWLFGPRNKMRVFLTQVITNPWFDRVVLALIAFSSILMAFENPRETNPEWMSTVSRTLTVVFTVEAALKIVAFGLIFHPTAYARDPWNLLDGAIVIIALLAWILETTVGGSQIAAIKVLRTLRCLRPLRVINRNRGLRMVISTLVLSMKGIANVALINGLVYLIFSILGVQLFAGSMHSCNDVTIHLKEECVGNFTVEDFVPIHRPHFKIINGNNVSGMITSLELANVTTDRHWRNADWNFDNTYNAFLNLLHVVTLDDWGTTMWAVIDSVGPDKGPIKNNRPYWGLYFVVFITVGCFFLLNMFVGVIISSFSAVKEKMDGSSMLTKDQKLWVETQRLMLNFRPERRRRPVFPNSSFCQFFFRIAEAPSFEAATGVAVALNVVFIGLNHQDESQEFSDMLRIANYVFLGCFVLEGLIKLFAYGLVYFRSGWNCFDFFLIAIGFVDILTDGIIPINLGILRVFRVFRIMRMLVLVRRARSVRVLLETLWYSLPSLVNIGTFLLLIFFMYAVLGTQLFAKVKRTHGLNDNVNFENFGNSFLFLIQLVTLDNWGAIMLATMNTEDCGPDDCGTAWAPLYFFTFIIVASWVIMNLFVAIILDNFNNTMQLDKSKLKMAHLKKFTDSWSEFDPEATLIMETKHFPGLLLALHSPLGIDRVSDRKKIMQLADNYRIVEHGGVIHFVETMVPMARRVLGVEFSEAELRAHEDHWRVQFPSLAKLKILRYKMKRVTVDQYFGATYLSAAYRRRAAYRYVNTLRDEKLAQLEKWYDDHGVEQDRRAASLRHLVRAEARNSNKDQFHLRKADDDNDMMSSRATSRAASRIMNTSLGAGGFDNVNTSGLGDGVLGSVPQANLDFDPYDPANRISRTSMRRASMGRSLGNTINAMGIDRGEREGNAGISIARGRWNRIPELMGLGSNKKKGKSSEAKLFFSS